MKFTRHRKIHPASQQMEATLNKRRQCEIHTASQNSRGIGKFIQHLNKWRQRSTNAGNAIIATFTHYRKIHPASQQIETMLNKWRQRDFHAASRNSRGIGKFILHCKVHAASENSSGITKFKRHRKGYAALQLTACLNGLWHQGH